jgi:uncharacterized membrane protein YczE
MRTRWILVVTGQAMIGAGAGALIVAGFGADPYSVLIDGVASTLSVLHVFAAFMCAAMCIAVGAVLGGKVRAVTVVAPLCASLALQVGVLAPSGVATAVVAVIMYLAGLSIYLGSGVGAGAVEFVAVTIAERHGKFSWFLNGSLIVYGVIGVITGGSVGLLTVALAVVSGPVVDVGRRFVAGRLR